MAGANLLADHWDSLEKEVQETLSLLLVSYIIQAEGLAGYHGVEGYPPVLADRVAPVVYLNLLMKEPEESLQFALSVQDERLRMLIAMDATSRLGQLTSEMEAVDPRWLEALGRWMEADQSYDVKSFLARGVTDRMLERWSRAEQDKWNRWCEAYELK